MLYLDVACNDPDSGNFAEKAFQLQIGEAELEPIRYGAAPRFIDMGGSIRLAGKRWYIGAVKTWYGNWCWNRYLLYREEIPTRWYMVEFVTWLRKRQLFHCSTGPSEFYDWFNGSADVAPAEVHRILGGLER